MNILYITHYEGLYGANKSLLELVKNIKNKYDCNVIVITPKYGELNDELTKAGIENLAQYFFPWAVPANENKVKNLIKYIGWLSYNKYSMKKMKKIVKEKNIEIIHTNSSISDIGAKIAKKLNIVHFWHIREYGKEDYNIKYFKYKYANFIERYSNKVIFISKDLQKKYEKEISKEKQIVIYNGVDKEKYWMERDRINSTDLSLLVTGLISENKNQLEVLKALDILINKKKYNNISCKIVGGGDEKYIQLLKDYVDKNNLTNNVQFTGYISNIKTILNESNIGIIPSKMEAFGRVTIEYMLAGLPVIGSKAGANIELIKDGFNGQLYELGNSQELAINIEKYYLNRNLLHENSSNAQIFALNNYTSEINSENIYSLYNNK